MRLRCRLLTPRSPDEASFVADALVVVEEGRFVAVGPYDGSPAEDVRTAGVIAPGFVDAHVHAAQARIVGSASGPLLDWLARSTFPEEARFADPTHAELVAERFAAELIRAGTTLCLAYASVHPHAADAVLSALDRAGLRGVVGPVLMDTHSPAALTLAAGPALDALDALVDRWHGHDGRLEVAVLPRFALSCTADLMRRAGDLSRARGLLASTHLSENPDECRVAVERFGSADYLRIYEDAGLVHDRSVFAHCIHLSDSEWDRLTTAGAVVAHCPDSNDFLGSGGMPLRPVLDRDVRVAVGTDVAAGRSFRVPRTLSHAYDNALRQGVSLHPRRLFWWATRGGALALGHDVGQVAVGLDADMVLLTVPEWAGDIDEVLGHVVFDESVGAARVWVRGRELRVPAPRAPRARPGAAG